MFDIYFSFLCDGWDQIQDLLHVEGSPLVHYTSLGGGMSPIKTGVIHPFYSADPRSWNDPYKRPSLRSLPGPVSYPPPCKKYAQDPDSSTCTLFQG